MIFGKLTERAQLVLVEAQKESQYFKHGYIGTEHILLGLLKEGGYAKQVLYINGATIDKVRKLLKLIADIVRDKINRYKASRR